MIITSTELKMDVRPDPSKKKNSTFYSASQDMPIMRKRKYLFMERKFQILIFIFVLIINCTSICLVNIHTQITVMYTTVHLDVYINVFNESWFPGCNVTCLRSSFMPTHAICEYNLFVVRYVYHVRILSHTQWRLRIWGSAVIFHFCITMKLLSSHKYI